MCDVEFFQISAGLFEVEAAARYQLVQIESRLLAPNRPLRWVRVGYGVGVTLKEETS